MHIFSYRLQMKSKYSKNKKGAHKVQPRLSLMFFITLWNLLWSTNAQIYFFEIITKQNVADSDVIYVSVLFLGTNQNLCIIS